MVGHTSPTHATWAGVSGQKGDRKGTPVKGVTLTHNPNEMIHNSCRNRVSDPFSPITLLQSYGLHLQGQQYEKR